MKLKSYIFDVYKMRHFCAHLISADIRGASRASYLGLIWPIIQPLAISAILTLILGTLFKQEMKYYAPFIYTGIVFWEFVIKCLTGGATAYIQAEPYIKQIKTPLIIYPIRIVIVNVFFLMLGLSGALVWSLYSFPENLNLSWLSLLPAIVIYTFCGVGAAVVFSYMGTYFRDTPNITALIMQILWFATPVYFLPSFFIDAGAQYLVDLNPLYHLMELVRAPLLQGKVAGLTSYLMAISFTFVLLICGAIVNYKFERRLVYAL